MNKTEENKEKGFVKNGQIKVSQNPEEGLKKLAENEKEYGIDDLVEDSVEEEDVSKECE